MQTVATVVCGGCALPVPGTVAFSAVCTVTVIAATIWRATLAACPLALQSESPYRVISARQISHKNISKE